MYDKKIYKSVVTCSWSPSSYHKLSHFLVTYFMDGPQWTELKGARRTLVESETGIQFVQHNFKSA